MSSFHSRKYMPWGHACTWPRAQEIIDSRYQVQVGKENKTKQNQRNFNAGWDPCLLDGFLRSISISILFKKETESVCGGGGKTSSESI